MRNTALQITCFLVLFLFEWLGVMAIARPIQGRRQFIPSCSRFEPPFGVGFNASGMHYTHLFHLLWQSPGFEPDRIIEIDANLSATDGLAMRNAYLDFRRPLPKLCFTSVILVLIGTSKLPCKTPNLSANIKFSMLYQTKKN